MTSRIRRLEMRSGETLSGVRIVVSDHPTSVRGRLVDDKGTPVTSATVVAFARDSQKWFEESRWIRAVRPDRQGNLPHRDGLPPGEHLRSPSTTSKTARGTTPRSSSRFAIAASRLR